MASDVFLFQKRLGILFNGLEGLAKIQYGLLLYIIEFSQKNERLGVLNSTFADIDSITKNWNLPPKQHRILLARIIDVLEKSTKYKFYKKWRFLAA